METLKLWSTHPDEFYKELFRLKQVPYPPREGTQKPRYVGHWTNDIVYSRLAPGVLKKLKELTPRTPIGIIQRLMGHAHISTTMVYLHWSPDDLEGAIKKLSFALTGKRSRR